MAVHLHRSFSYQKLKQHTCHIHNNNVCMGRPNNGNSTIIICLIDNIFLSKIILMRTILCIHNHLFSVCVFMAVTSMFAFINNLSPAKASIDDNKNPLVSIKCLPLFGPDAENCAVEMRNDKLYLLWIRVRVCEKPACVFWAPVWGERAEYSKRYYTLAGTPHLTINYESTPAHPPMGWAARNYCEYCHTGLLRFCHRRRLPLLNILWWWQWLFDVGKVLSFDKLDIFGFLFGLTPTIICWPFLW